MRAAAAPSDFTRRDPLRVSVERLQNTMLWLLGISSSIVFIEPGPYELMMAATVGIFILTGISLRPQLYPLIVLFGLLNIAFSIASIDLYYQKQVLTWVLTAWFMMVTCIFYAAAFAENTEARLTALTNGYVIAAVVASLAGILAYFRIIPFYDLFTLYGRARGTFKDPNVLGAFLIYPAIIALQRILLGSLAQAMRNTIVLGIISLAIFLSFSRAAWGQLVFCGSVLALLMIITTQSSKDRTRIVLIGLLAAAAAIVLLAGLLSLDVIANLFKERASLKQSYDLGEQGRFGRYILGANLALDRPWGIGPLQFSTIFPEDTHNSYLNAFMSGGWLSGAVYPVMTLLTVFVATKQVLVRTPWQRLYLAIYAAYLGTMFESFIIDTDHWRHYFVFIGAIWGVAIANQAWRARQRPGPVPPVAAPAPLVQTWRAAAR